MDDDFPSFEDPFFFGGGGGRFGALEEEETDKDDKDKYEVADAEEVAEEDNRNDCVFVLFLFNNSFSSNRSNSRHSFNSAFNCFLEDAQSSFFSFCPSTRTPPWTTSSSDNRIRFSETPFSPSSSNKSGKDGDRGGVRHEGGDGGDCEGVGESGITRSSLILRDRGASLCC